MDRLRSLDYFIAAAEESSFSGAARRHGVSAAAVSKLVAALERSLGIKLFERHAHGLVLTAGGGAYLEACRPALAQLADAVPFPMVEGGVGVALRGRRIAVEDDDLTVLVRERHRGPEARHSRTDDQDALAHAEVPYRRPILPEGAGSLAEPNAYVGEPRRFSGSPFTLARAARTMSISALGIR